MSDQGSMPSLQSAGGENPAAESAGSSALGRDLIKFFLLWLVVVLSALPLLWLVHRNRDRFTETIKVRDPAFRMARAQADYHRGKLYVQQNDYNKAAFYLERAYRDDPTLLDALYQLGIVYQQRGDLPEAENYLIQVLQKDSDYSPARLSLGEIYAQQGRLLDAWEIMLPLPDDLPEDSPLRFDWKLNSRMADLANQVLESQPENRTALLALALTAMDRGDWEEAERLYGRILQMYPRDLFALTEMATVSRLKEDEAQTVERLINIIRRSPRRVSTYYAAQNAVDKSGDSTGRVLQRMLNTLERSKPQYSVQAVEHRGLKLVGFDYLPEPRFSRNDFLIQLQWLLTDQAYRPVDEAQSLQRMGEGLYYRAGKFYQHAENLIANPGFEKTVFGTTLPKDWTYQLDRTLGDFARSWAEVILDSSGETRVNRFLRIDLNRVQPLTWVSVLSKPVPVKPEMIYLLGFRIRADGGNPKAMVRWVSAENKTVRWWETRPDVSGNKWTMFYVVLTSPRQATSAGIFISNNFEDQSLPEGNKRIDVDDVFFIELREVNFLGQGSP